MINVGAPAAGGRRRQLAPRGRQASRVLARNVALLESDSDDDDYEPANQGSSSESEVSVIIDSEEE